MAWDHPDQFFALLSSMFPTFVMAVLSVAWMRVILGVEPSARASLRRVDGSEFQCRRICSRYLQPFLQAEQWTRE